MSKLNTAIKSQSGEYNFLNDDSIGAIGTIGLQIYLPVNSVVTRFYVKVLTNFTSAGAATMRFQLSSYIAGPYLMNATNFAAFVVGQPIAGNDFNANPILVSSPLTPTAEVQMVIATAPITDGRLAFFIEYNEFDV